MDFFAELRKLVYAKPRNRTQNRSAENSAYGDYLSQVKNTYLCFFGSELKDCYFCEYAYKSNDCVDCIAISQCELCYECIDCTEVYDGRHLQDCHNCASCFFSVDLINCKNCFGCFGLRNCQYYIFNKKYSEEEYRKKLAGLLKQSPQKILEELLPYFAKHPRLYARLLKGEENCYGDYIYFSKNCYLCFGVSHTSDSGYLYDVISTSTPCAESYDCTFSGGIQNCYECSNTVQATDSNFLINCAGVSESEYCIDTYNCRNCFGCAYIENKDFHILNRPFSPQEYAITLRQIKDLLKSQGQYGKTWAEILQQ